IFNLAACAARQKKMKKWILASAGAAGLLLSSVALARVDVGVSIGIPGVFAPPVYVAPAPVYVAPPAPVYVAPPAPVYMPPPPVYVRPRVVYPAPVYYRGGPRHFHGHPGPGHHHHRH